MYEDTHLSEFKLNVYLSLSLSLWLLRLNRAASSSAPAQKNPHSTQSSPPPPVPVGAGDDNGLLKYDTPPSAPLSRVHAPLYDGAGVWLPRSADAEEAEVSLFHKKKKKKERKKVPRFFFALI